MLCAALNASAHDLYPIRPVRATLLVEPDRIVLDLRADSIIWIEEVTGLHPMPARDWPAETLAKVEAYANSHFRLTADGLVLKGSLVSALYRQFPWEVNEEGVFFLRLIYPPAPGGAVLSGAALFYEEYRQELKGEFGQRPLPYAEGYRTILRMPGSRSVVFTLTPEVSSFTITADAARRTAFDMAGESLLRGAQTVLNAASCFPALLAVALCLGVDTPSRAFLGGLVLSAVLGLSVGPFLNAPPGLIWLATIGTSLSSARAWRRDLGAVAVFCLGLAWSGPLRTILPHSEIALPSALIGVLATGALLLFCIRSGMRAEYRRLAALSAAHVDDLFARRARLAATALAMVGAYGFLRR